MADSYLYMVSVFEKSYIDKIVSLDNTFLGFVFRVFKFNHLQDIYRTGWWYTNVSVFWKPRELSLKLDAKFDLTKWLSINYVRKIFRKTNVSNPLIRTRTCANEGVRNVSFLEYFAHVLNGWPLKLFYYLLKSDLLKLWLWNSLV